MLGAQIILQNVPTFYSDLTPPFLSTHRQCPCYATVNIDQTSQLTTAAQH